jgi:hypothetical protein
LLLAFNEYRDGDELGSPIHKGQLFIDTTYETTAASLEPSRVNDENELEIVGTTKKRAKVRPQVVRIDVSVKLLCLSAVSGSVTSPHLVMNLEYE